MKPSAPLLRILILLAMAFGGTLGGIVLAQDRLLYFPERAPLAEMMRFAAPPLKVVPWPSGDGVRALLFEPAAGRPAGTIIVFHGNAGHAGHRAYYAEMLVALGWRVLLAEYPGYGPRDGALGEASLVPDAARTISLAQRDFGPVVLLGESLGAGVAAAASASLQHQGVSAILLLTPWDTLANVAAYHYPWLPVRWLLRDRYDSVANLRQYAGRVIVVVAENDRIVPAIRGRVLHEELAPRSALIVIAGADHNDWFDRVDAGWWRELLKRLPPETTASVD